MSPAIQGMPPPPQSLATQVRALAASLERQKEMALMTSRKGGKGEPFERTVIGHVFKSTVPGVRYTLSDLKELMPEGHNKRNASYVAYELSNRNRVFKRGTPGKFTYERPAVES